MSNEDVRLFQDVIWKQLQLRPFRPTGEGEGDLYTCFGKLSVTLRGASLLTRFLDYPTSKRGQSRFPFDSWKRKFVLDDDVIPQGEPLGHSRIISEFDAWLDPLYVIPEHPMKFISEPFSKRSLLHLSLAYLPEEYQSDSRLMLVGDSVWAAMPFRELMLIRDTAASEGCDYVFFDAAGVVDPRFAELL